VQKGSLKLLLILKHQSKILKNTFDARITRYK
jgi:hypothetical protein